MGKNYPGWTRREVAMMIETKRLRALNKALFRHIDDLTDKTEGNAHAPQAAAHHRGR